jgi:putative membrane protein
MRGRGSRADWFFVEAPSKEARNGAAREISSLSFPKEVAVVRDNLAHHRTVLANERTLLASVRTALAVFVAGVSLATFFDALAMEVVGWMLVPCAAIILMLAIARYRKIGGGLTLEVEMDGGAEPSGGGAVSR